MRSCEECQYVFKYREDTDSKTNYYCSLMHNKNNSTKRKKINSVKQAGNCAWFLKRDMVLIQKNKRYRIKEEQL